MQFRSIRVYDEDMEWYDDEDRHITDTLFNLPFCECTEEDIEYIEPGALSWVNFDLKKATISPYMSKYLEDKRKDGLDSLGI